MYRLAAIIIGIVDFLYLVKVDNAIAFDAGSDFAAMIGILFSLLGVVAVAAATPLSEYSGTLTLIRFPQSFNAALNPITHRSEVTRSPRFLFVLLGYFLLAVATVIAILFLFS
jgi:hypothetical protein